MTNDAKTCDTCGAPVHKNVHGEIWHIRADHIQIAKQYDHAQAELQAAVAAEREAIAYEICELEEHDAAQHGWGDGEWLAKRIASAIRSRGDADAQGALEAVKREARNEALREAAVKLKTYAPHLEDGPEHDVGYYHGYHTALNRIIALMEDTDDE